MFTALYANKECYMYIVVSQEILEIVTKALYASQYHTGCVAMW